MSATVPKAVIYTSPKRSLYVGKLEPVLKRANVNATLLVSTGENLTLLSTSGKPLVHSKSLLVPAGLDISIATRNANIAVFFLDDLGADFATLIPQMKSATTYDNGQTILSGLRHEKDIITHANFLSKTRPSSDEVFTMVESCIGYSAAAHTPLTDERVAKAVRLIRENCQDNMSVAQIAEQVNLSVPRLIQIFKQVTGTPIRRFRLWQRIFVTACKLAEGLSLTEAALAAGFADYAQFSRVYKELAGGSPAAAKNNTEIRVSAG